ncbi:MAG: hypothetical protein GY950_09725, partial [bacterium]|nr:hypothetical protein [bacterium]
MDLKNATLKEILSYILPPLKLKYKWEGKNLHIYSDPLLTRYFNLNYISSTRKGKRQVSFSTRSGGSAGSGGGGGGGSTGGTGSGGTGSSGSGGSTGGGGGGQNQSSSQISTEYENTLWETFIDSLKVLVFGALEDIGEADTSPGSSSESIKSFAYAHPSGKKL